MKDILDPNVYRRLPRDPTSRILRRTNQLLKESSIPEEEQRIIKKSEAIAPRLYGLPKIHKQEVPLRPIVSAIGSPTYALSKYLCSLLRPHIGKTKTFIKRFGAFCGKTADSDNTTWRSTRQLRCGIAFHHGSGL